MSKQTDSISTDALIEKLQVDLAAAQKTLEAQELAYRSIVSDYKHCSDSLHAVTDQQEAAVLSRGDGWIRALDEEMVRSFLGVASPDESYEDAKAKLNLLISWSNQVACDPAVNGGFVLMPAVLDDAMQEVLRCDGYRALVAFVQKVGDGQGREK